MTTPSAAAVVNRLCSQGWNGHAGGPEPELSELASNEHSEAKQEAQLREL